MGPLVLQFRSFHIKKDKERKILRKRKGEDLCDERLGYWGKIH